MIYETCQCDNHCNVTQHCDDGDFWARGILYHRFIAASACLDQGISSDSRVHVVKLHEEYMYNLWRQLVPKFLLSFQRVPQTSHCLFGLHSTCSMNQMVWYVWNSQIILNKPFGNSCRLRLYSTLIHGGWGLCSCSYFGRYIYTETANKDGTWLREISSSCCLTTGGKTRQLLLIKIYIPFLSSLYLHKG